MEAWEKNGYLANTVPISPPFSFEQEQRDAHDQPRIRDVEDRPVRDMDEVDDVPVHKSVKKVP